MARPLLIVDGDNLAHRAYHSVPKTIRGTHGEAINAVVGWTNMVLAVWESERPRAVFTAWDTLGVDTYRHRLWPKYQAGRVFEAELIEQLDRLPEVAAAFGFGVGKRAGYEADDLIASAAAAETGAGGSCLVLTNDRDAYQLASEHVVVLAPRAGIAELARIGPEEVVERVGVLPEQVPDFKALAGDPSDNIPGIRGIGPKSAAVLLLRHGTLERVLDARGISGAEAEQILMFREVIRMKPEVPVDVPTSGPPHWAEAAVLLDGFGAAALARRLSQRARPPQSALPLGEG